MSLSSLFKRIHLVDPDLELAIVEKRIKLVDVEFEFLARFDVSKQCGTGHLDALGRQFPATKIVSTEYNMGFISNRRKSRKGQKPYGRGNGGTGPLALPNQMTVPFFLTTSNAPSQVSFPTES